MLKQILKSGALIAGLAMAGVASLPVAASAFERGSVEAGLYIGVGSGERYSRGYDRSDWRGDERHRGDRHRGDWHSGGPRRGYFESERCTPREAVKKAQYRFGLRRAHIDRITRNTIVVKGRKWGDRRSIAFNKRSSHCSVRYVR